MEYHSQSPTQRSVSRLLVTLVAICLPIVAATFFSGSFFRAGTLQPGEVFNATAANAAMPMRAHSMTMSMPNIPAVSTETGTPQSGCNTTADVSISITESGFNPSSITVSPATRVTWTNNGAQRHRVRDVNHAIFDSDDLYPGQSFSFTFCNPGTYNYEDSRSGFTAIIVVSGTPGTGTPGVTTTRSATPGATVTEDRTGTPGTTTTPQTTTTPGGGNIVDVQIQRHDVFVPANITIATGTTVRWTNTDDEQHTTTSDTGVWNSGALDAGQTFLFTFLNPGTYLYSCLIHPEMRGTITVTGPALTPTPGGSTPTPQATNTPGSGQVNVNIQNFAFQPQNLTVNVGTTIRWTNMDTAPHTSTSDTGVWNSGILNQGQTYQFTFNTVGAFAYHCDIHPGMHGSITVTNGSGGTATATTQPTQTAQATNTPAGTTTAVATSTVQATTTVVATNTPGSGQVSVNIQNFAFQPQNLTVNVGTTIRWTNMDTAPHTSTCDTGVWNSGILNQGQTYQFTFNTVGAFTYHCDIHPGMHGAITVTNGSGGTATATATTQPTQTAQVTSTPAITVSATRMVQGTSTSTAQSTNTPAPQIINVSIQSYAYSPASITIPAGATVRWTNLDNDRHSITSMASPPVFDSGEFNLNGTWSYTFNTPGAYSYFCTVHGAFMSATVIVQAAPPTATATPTRAPGQIFNDVTPNDYFYTAVNWLVSRNIVSGYSDGTFRPFNNTTRGQVTKMAALGEGWTVVTPQQPTFTDVAPSDAFYGYVETAVQHNIISGYSDHTFRPGNNVTRGQLTKIVVSARGWTLANPSTPTFTDVPVGDAFYGYVETAVQHAIISGYSDHTFRPGNNAVRGQIAKILYSALSGAR